MGNKDAVAAANKARARPLAVRVAERTDRREDGACWPWLGPRNAKGYGTIKVGQSSRLAHRMAFLALVGPIPEGMCVCHRCDNPPCCNPKHLFAASQRDNVLDCVQKKRHRCSKKTHCPSGHEYTPENTRIRVSADGLRRSRACRACGKISSALQWKNRTRR